MIRRPGPVEVIGVEGADHYVTLDRIRDTGDNGWQPYARCACGWSTVDVTIALTLLKVHAHLRMNAAP